MSDITYKEPTQTDNMISNLLVLLCSIIIILLGFFALESIGILIYSIIILIVISALVYWHTVTRGFYCKACGHEFSISFWQNLSTANAILTKKKFLTCPKCKNKDYMSELIKEKIK